MGWLDWQSSGPYAEQTSNGFLQGLREGGFVEGKNLAVVRGAAEGEWRRFSELARVMAAAKVDVFFTPGKASTDAAWYASRSTPTVFATVNDPVALGYVKSLGRPGMQVTGVPYRGEVPVFIDLGTGALNKAPAWTAVSTNEYLP